ncbi:hypothetical protein [Achromobacter sp. Bel]|uniref:hypothetical protein n=1 Tax=Achromobacter sp. Bel TaxID=2727415 RepID=UPI00145D85C5|nr:hypothetical protein [Achromobacter sp. Bel]NMK46048.1 hypothetical protein [Achromobacter sp. Bel]
MEKMELTTQQDDTEHQIQPLETGEISTVSGGASSKKPTIAMLQPRSGNSATAAKSSFYQR